MDVNEKNGGDHHPISARETPDIILLKSYITETSIQFNSFRLVTPLVADSFVEQGKLITTPTLFLRNYQQISSFRMMNIAYGSWLRLVELIIALIRLTSLRSL